MIDVGTPLEVRATARHYRWQKLLPVGLVGLDALLVYAALTLAYWVRYVLQLGPAIQDHVTFSRYQPVGFLLVGLMLISLAARGAYRSRISREVVDEVTDILVAATISIALYIVFQQMSRSLQYSRAVTIYAWLFLVLTVSLGRGLIRVVQGALHRRGIGVRRLLVVGGSTISRMVMQSVMNRPDLGYQLVGFVDHRAGGNVRDFGRFRALGSMDALASVLDEHDVDEIILAVPASAHAETLTVLELCERHGMGLKLVPDLFEMSLSRVQVDDLAGIPLLDVREEPLRRAAQFVKRAFDLVGALLLLSMLSPAIALFALLIRFESPGPVFLRQKRVGLGGRVFTCFKFRTMREDAERLQEDMFEHNNTDGPIFKMREDPRCTRLGRHTRKWSADEIPQLWNVVLGDMSLVGPRPALPREVERYEDHQRRRLEVKPGMTGIWQVSGRSDLGFDEMVLMDVTYVDNWSLKLDTKLLIRTVVAVLRRHGAY